MDISQDDLLSMTGFTEEELNNFKDTLFGQKTLTFLYLWTDLTKRALSANRAVLDNCFKKIDSGEYECRFCEEGIPSWKSEVAREHKSECPINLVTDVIHQTAKLKNTLGDSDGEQGMEATKNPMSGNGDQT